MIGKTLAHYEITAELGRGGMGEVYRARDSRLDRDVAIKVLPSRLSENPEARARFEREAKTVSSLNHPHICTLHDVGSEGGVDFLVMELVEGETLSDRLRRGPLPLEDALQIGAQIADALDRAHRAGVIHRDLKPGNIMLMRSGAKLMDFGLARVTGLAGPDSVSALEQSPTIAQPLTAEGTILGTFQYMSPEQLEGSKVDASTDLWALGCVLYEMTTGRRAFDAGSQASLIAAIMHTRPEPVSAVTAMSPQELDRLVNACLEKDPADRMQSAHDLKLQLEWLVEGAAARTPVTKKPSAAAWQLLTTLMLAALLLGSALSWVLFQRESPDHDAIPRHYSVAELDLTRFSVPKLSPAGSYFVVSVNSGDGRQLHRRDAGSMQTTPIPGTEDGAAPFFSPDGSWLAFVTDVAIKKLPADGGLAQTVISYPRPTSATWGEDGYVYFTADAGGIGGDMALSRVPHGGGQPEVVARLDRDNGEIDAFLPEILPGGEKILLTIFGRGGLGARIVSIGVDGVQHTVRQGAFLGRFVPPNHLLFRDDDTLATLAIPFDPGTAKTTGTALPLTGPVEIEFCFDVNETDLVYVPLRGADEGNEVIWRDTHGTLTTLVEARALWRQPRLSPDGTRLLLRKVGTNCELWLLDIPRGTLQRLPQSDDQHDPIWSDDGKSIVFARAKRGELVSTTIEGSRETKVLLSGSEFGTPTSWAKGLITYTRADPGTHDDIWIYPTDGSTPPFAYLDSESAEREAALSPDARWIAYVSDESGRYELYLRRFPDDGTLWQVSTGGGQNPLWARDGSELYYRNRNKLIRVAVGSTNDLQLGEPEFLFDSGMISEDSRGFDVNDEGRFVTTYRPGDEGHLWEIRILQNWQTELSRLGGYGR